MEFILEKFGQIWLDMRVLSNHIEQKIKREYFSKMSFFCDMILFKNMTQFTLRERYEYNLLVISDGCIGLIKRNPFQMIQNIHAIHFYYIFWEQYFLLFPFAFSRFRQSRNIQPYEQWQQKYLLHILSCTCVMCNVCAM